MTEERRKKDEPIRKQSNNAIMKKGKRCTEKERNMKKANEDETKRNKKEYKNDPRST